MGHPDLPPPRTQRRTVQRRQFIGGAIVFALLALVLLCYSRASIIPTTLLAMTPLTSSSSADIDALPDLTHPTLLSTLPAALLPSPGRPGRLIVIGDVHGQLTALDALLAAAGYSAERGDTVVFTGDMVNKGPDSGGVVDRAMQIGALGVRGNHEDRVLRAWKKLRKNKGKKGKGKKKHGKKDVDGEAEGAREEEEVHSGDEEEEEDEPELTKSSALDRSTAATLTPTQVSWLARLPVILRLGAVAPRYGDVIVVHAGLVPGIPLEDQDPWAAMNMRTLISKSHSKALSSDPESSLASLTLSSTRHHVLKPSEGREGRPWAQVWNEAQKENAKSEGDGKKGKKDKTHRTTVIYGHDAKVGLSVRRYAFGLDSSCVKGGDLTALIFEPASSKSKPTFEGLDSSEEAEDLSDVDGGVDGLSKHSITHRIVSVPCSAPGSDDDKKGKKKKDKGKHKEKDKGKGEKKHKDHKD